MSYNKNVGRNLGNQLQQSLSAGHFDLIRRIADEAAVMGLPLYVVGGFVRDLALGYEGTDFDLVIEGDAVALARALVLKYGGKVTTHAKFGTAKLHVQDWKLADGMGKEDYSQLSVDLITSRSESYKHPAALPVVKVGTIEEDLRRRDFTINAMAIRLDGTHFGDLLDEVGGWDDVQNGLIRVLHPLSFLDDPTRMYRATRYEQRYGFKIFGETLGLIPKARAIVEKLSAQRIRHELDLILRERMVAGMLARLAQLDLLTPIHPTLPWDASVEARFQVEKRPELIDGRIRPETLGWLIWLMSLSHRQIELLHERLHFSASLQKLLLGSAKLFLDLPLSLDQKPSEYVELLAKFPIVAVYAVYIALPQNPSRSVLENYLAEWRHIRAKTTGHDLKKRGVLPGRLFHEILIELRNAWLDGQVKNVVEEQEFLVATLARLNVPIERKEADPIASND